MHVKRFLEWIGLKEKIHRSKQKVPYVSEGQIWWASLGENIGAEINGKSKDFTRPIIIFKKLTHSFYLGIPVSTQVKTGTWYVLFKQFGRKMVACLQQIRVIDYRRLHRKLGELDGKDFENIREGFRNLYI